jgi:ATP-dependent helicase HrpB
MPLPIDAVLPALKAALADSSAVVLQADPGAGKTTRVPLALLDQPWRGDRRILMLEPRRVAARMAARRMAESLGEPVGATVGYRLRGEARVGPATCIEVVTDGLFTRMAIHDPELAGVAAVLFDEVHERGLESDLGLALARDIQTGLRPDLKLVAMSATLDQDRLAAFLGGCPTIACPGRAFPVETRWSPPTASQTLEMAAASAVRALAAEIAGDILVFLPGRSEIARVARDLGTRLPAELVLLHGDLPPAAQDAAIRPAPDGRRRVVLATAIAETSLTLPGVRAVVDLGLARTQRFDPGTGMSRLTTSSAARANLDQRRGRAGRTAPGVCVRLWPEAAEGARPAFLTPEILVADLVPLALDLALWGLADPTALGWLDEPPPSTFADARQTLTDLGCLDAAGRVTAIGHRAADLPVHPRLGLIVQDGYARGRGALACLLAAALDGRDPMGRGAGVDIGRRIQALVGGGGADPTLAAAIRERARDLRRRLDIPAAPVSPDDLQAIGELTLAGFPDRVARRRPGRDPRYLTVEGRGMVLDPTDPLADAPWLVVAATDGDPREARVRLAAPIDEASVMDRLGARIVRGETVVWDPAARAVRGRRRATLGAILLADAPLAVPPPEVVRAGLIAAIRADGLSLLPTSTAFETLRARVAFARRLDGETAWPDLADAALLATLEVWLGPALVEPRLDAVDPGHALATHLGRRAMDELGRVAPPTLVAPTGSALAIDYAADPPMVAVKVQELFGLQTTPTVGRGRVALALSLLSPAGRPIQVTRDIAGFWRGSWPDVAKEMRGRYPRHPWPDDPATALPTRRAKPRV